MTFESVVDKTLLDIIRKTPNVSLDVVFSRLRSKLPNYTIYDIDFRLALYRLTVSHETESG